MTTKEFSQEFDTKLNSYDSFNAYGLTIGESIILNEYEKSIYLTNAQEELIKEYNDVTNKLEKNIRTYTYLYEFIRE